MDNIKKYIDGYLTGNDWEELCVKCYRIRYQADNYVAIPAVHCGDAGIEGFTNKGLVHQCYGPEREYSDNELYEHQRSKLTTDIEKLKNNADRLKKLGVPQVVEWHFNIPEYRDSRIIEHAESKRREVLSEKASNPTRYLHIADNFNIVIKTAEDFAPEISRIVRSSIYDMKLSISTVHKSTPDWTKCSSEKVNNIRRKLKAVMLVDEPDDYLDRAVNLYIECYINGIEMLNNMRVAFPEIYEALYSLEQSYKREVSMKTLINPHNNMNKSIFDKILDEFQEKLEREFSSIFNESSICSIKDSLIASWLADCSMEFRG